MMAALTNRWYLALVICVSSSILCFNTLAQDECSSLTGRLAGLCKAFYAVGCESVDQGPKQCSAIVENYSAAGGDISDLVVCPCDFSEANLDAFLGYPNPDLACYWDSTRGGGAVFEDTFVNVALFETSGSFNSPSELTHPSCGLVPIWGTWSSPFPDWEQGLSDLEISACRLDLRDYLIKLGLQCYIGDPSCEADCETDCAALFDPDSDPAAYEACRDACYEVCDS